MLLYPTPERIEKWRDKGNIKSLLKSLECYDVQIKEEAIWALGDVFDNRPVPKKYHSKIIDSILKIANNLQKDDKLILPCVTALLHFKNLKIKKFYEKILISMPKNFDVIDWVISGLRDGGDADTCWLVLELFKNKKTDGFLKENLIEIWPLFNEIIQAEGSNSDLLKECCELAQKKGEAQRYPLQVLINILNYSKDSGRNLARSWKKSNHSVVCNYAVEYLGPGEGIPPVDRKEGHPHLDRKLVEMLKDVAAGKEHHPNLSDLAAKIGKPAIPILKQYLESELHGPLGLAAIVALKKFSPKLALPLISEAFRSDYGAVRFYAAEYLATKRSTKGKELARKQLRSETEEDVRELLEDAVK